ncbi:MAG: HAD family hydrolase [Anaerolineae bacterium]
MLQAIIFDFDGLILDTETPVLQSWQELYREFGMELPVEEWLKCIGADYGPETFDPYADLEQRRGQPVDWPRVKPRRYARELEIVAGQPLLPGVQALIDDAIRHGVRLAIASSSPHEWVDGHLARLGLLTRFDAILCADDVAQVKPAPDLFLRALEALHVPARQAVVLEDSPHGIEAARTAGIMGVAVPSDLTRRLDFSGAAMRVQSLAELDVALLARALRSNHR